MWQWQKTKHGKAAIKAAKKDNNGHSKNSNNSKPLNKMSKKELQAKIASLQNASGNDEGGGGDTDNDSSSSPTTFTIDQVRAMISVANATPNYTSDDSNKSYSK